MNLSEDLLSLGGNQLLFLCSCSLIFAVAKAPHHGRCEDAQLLTSANPDFNESLAGPRQTGTKEMGVSAKPCVQRSAEAMRCAARFLLVARLAPVIAVDVPHHVTQRGNARRFILDCDADRMAYL